MAIKGIGIGAKPIFMIIMLAMVGLYLFTQFTVQKESFEFTVPEDINTTTLMVFKILMIGVITYAAMVLAGKLGAPLGKKDAFTLILLGIAVWFLWDKFIGPLLQSGTIDELGTRLAQAVLKP